MLSHAIPSGDLAKVLERLIAIAIPQVEKRRFAATEKPRPRRSSANPRHIPAHMKSAVWQRDRGQCTFVGEGGHLCASRKFLELDHVDPVARGGQATVEGMRLRCRAHNQYEAECVFGAGFMTEKREAARRAAKAQAAAKARAGAQARAAAETREAAETRQATEARALAKAAAAEVIPWLRQLGLRADEARRAAARCETIPGASLEQRVRVALSSLQVPRTARVHLHHAAP